MLLQKIPKSLAPSQDQLQALQEVLRNTRKAVVLTHTSIDKDAFGSAMGLLLLLKANYGFPIYFVTEEQIPQYWVSLVKSGKENIVKTDRVLDTINQLAPSTIFVVDINHADRLTGKEQDVKGLRDLLNGGVKFSVVLDHHVYNEAEYGSVRVVKPFTSASELVTTVALQLDWEFTAEAADLLLLGILGDTGRLRWIKNPITLNLAQVLFNVGADWHKVYTMQTPIFTQEALELLEELLQGLTVEGDVGYLVIPYENYSILDLALYKTIKDWFIEEIFSGLSVPNLVWVTEKERGKFYVSLRSKEGGADVSMFAKKYGGGGHTRAAGFRVRGAQDIVKRIIRDFKQFVS